MVSTGPELPVDQQDIDQHNKQSAVWNILDK